MFKGTITSTAVTENANIPFTVVWNTNDNTAYNTTTNVIEFNNSGYYDIMLNLVVTGATDTTISAQLFANGVARPNAIATTDITATTGTQTLTVFDTIKVDATVPTSLANISARVTDSVTATGIITVEKRK